MDGGGGGREGGRDGQVDGWTDERTNQPTYEQMGGQVSESQEGIGLITKISSRFEVDCCLLATTIIPSMSGMFSRGPACPSYLDMKTVLALYEFPLMGLLFAQDHGIIP